MRNEDRMDKNYKNRLEQFLRETLSKPDLTLTKLVVNCASWVYRADPGPLFVKVRSKYWMEGAKKTIKDLAAFGDYRFTAHNIIDKPLIFEDTIAVVQSWQEGATVLVPSMSDAQVRSLVAGYKTLLPLLASGKFELAETRDPEKFYSQIEAAIKRNGIFGRILGYIKDIPYEERTYGNKIVIHGDMQYRNFGFTGDELTAFFDLESQRLGSPVEDLLYLITDSYRKKRLTSSKRCRVEEILKLVIRLYGYPREEWIRTLNIQRLRVIAKRVHKYGWNPIVMIDAYQRDKPLRHLADVLRNWEGFGA